MGIDKGARGLAVLEEKAEVVTHCLLCTKLVGIVTSTLSKAVESGGCDATPVVGVDIAVGLALAKPIAVPVADGNLVHVVGGLVPLQCFQCRHHLLGSIQVLLCSRNLIDFAKELNGRGYDGLFVVYLKLGEIQTILHEDVGSGLEVVEQLMTLKIKAGLFQCFKTCNDRVVDAVKSVSEITV